MDLNKLARKCADIEEWTAAVSDAGYISDNDRLNMVDILITGKMVKDDRHQAMEVAMGNLGGMQNSARCFNWWEIVIEDQDAVRAAIKAGLPFSSNMQGGDNQVDGLLDILKRSTEKDESSAILIWLSSSEKTRQDITRSIFENMAWAYEPLFEESIRWLDLLQETASLLPVSDKKEMLSIFLVNRFSIFEPETAPTHYAHLSRVSATLFPSGMKQEQVDFIKVEAKKYYHHNYAAMCASIDLVMAPLVSLDVKEVLSSQTCLPKAPTASAGRRI